MANKINGLYGNFVLVGTPIYKEDKFYTGGKSDGGFVHHRVQFGVKTSDSNVVYVELSGGYSSTSANKIYSIDKDKAKLEIKWENRFDSDVINNVADFKKIKINFTSSDEKNSNEFLAEYDAVKYIKDNIKKDTRVVVQGSIKIERYKDKNSGEYKTITKYTIQKIRLAKEDEVNKAEATMSFVFDKDSWDARSGKKDSKVYVNGYFTTYDKPSKKNIFVPMMFTLDTSKLDMENEKHKAIFNFYESCFSAKKKEYYETQWHCNIVKGSTMEEITEADLTAEQKLQIELGITDFETIARGMRGGKAGDKIDEVRLVRPTNKFDGSVNFLTNYEEDDFFVEVEPKNESFEEIMNDVEKTGEDESDRLIKELFGGN